MTRCNQNECIEYIEGRSVWCVVRIICIMGWSLIIIECWEILNSSLRSLSNGDSWPFGELLWSQDFFGVYSLECLRCDSITPNAECCFRATALASKLITGIEVVDCINQSATTLDQATTTSLRVSSAVISRCLGKVRHGIRKFDWPFLTWIACGVGRIPVGKPKDEIIIY